MVLSTLLPSPEPTVAATTDTYIIIQRATDIGPVDGRDEGQVLPVLSFQVVKVLVAWGTVPGDNTTACIGL